MWAEPQETSTNSTASSRVVVLSYSRYCRHRALAKRLEPSKKFQSDVKLEKVCTKMENIKIETSSSSDSTNLQSTAKQISNSQLKQEGSDEDGDDKSKIVKTESEDDKSVEDVNKALAESLLMSPEMQDALIQALGGYVADDRNTKILFCRETFSYPDLETHEMLCNHLAPKLKGRPRGRRKKQILPVYNSTKKRQLLSVNSDKNKGRKGHQDDDDERRMLQMLAGLSDSGGEMSGPDGAGDSDDMGSEHMPCAATVARMSTGGGRRGLRCNSRKPVKNNAVITPTVYRVVVKLLCQIMGLGVAQGSI
ncbi:uncharacterized protein LOC113386396 [Ctenocephalides felis]|uniref:uncharacterized protein LOC113386396 n=1 Tax=Ctenocephalides felis TaxID=7515 RepID=UPI000E6E43D6|nr:uncharacterized protein LOC113386396 [Ctenocephalides felis]